MNSPSTSFTVRVSPGNGDYLVTVDYEDGTEYAKTMCSDLDTALKMAVPYMAAMAQPDPLLTRTLGLNQPSTSAKVVAETLRPGRQ